MNNEVSEYVQQGLDFLKKYEIEMNVEFLYNGKHFKDDKELRDVYQITLTRKGKKPFSVKFGQSIAKSGFYYTKGVQKIEIDRKYLGSKNLSAIIRRMDWDFLNNGKSDKIHRPEEPTAYDLLTCITKYDPETFEDFCSKFGYDTDSRKAEKIYNAVREEWFQVLTFFTSEEIEELHEIQ